MAANAIVRINVSQQIAPTPDKLQQTGAIVSFGGTTTDVSDETLLTELSDLTAILGASALNSSQVWAASQVTITTSAAHGLPTSDVISITITDAVPSQYNGTFDCTVATSNTLVHTLVGDPGICTTAGSWELADVAQLRSQGTTFFAQGGGQAAYVLELGPMGWTAGVAALSDWIIDNPGFFYAYLVPRAFADEETYLDLIALYESPTAKLYFCTTATTDNYTNFTSLMKDVLVEVEAPDTPATEFSAAATFYDMLRYRPSSTNKVTPFDYTFQYGVTAWPARGTGISATITALIAASTNYVGLGSEGGISKTIIRNGTTRDGRDWTYWYSVDWVQINLDLNLANAIINGSNNPVNPLYYNQNGIDRLQQVCAVTMGTAIEDGLALGSTVLVQMTADQLDEALDADTFAGKIVINAIPFIPYVTAQPDDYPLGVYNGLSVTYVPARGFTSITINLVVSDFVAGA